MKYIIGIDEAGRGPLAGPVAIGAVLFSKGKYEKFKKENRTYGNKTTFRFVKRRRVFPHFVLKDSKQLTEIERKKWFEKIKENKNIRYIVCFAGVKYIDKFGIVNAMKKATSRVLKKFEISPNECVVLLDGNLKAPNAFINQKTIIKGDEKEPIISLASIVAKVKRDAKIINLSKKYPKYNFEKNKGYGTKEHYKKLKKYGFCAIHRRSFLKKFLMT